MAHGALKMNMVVTEAVTPCFYNHMKNKAYLRPCVTNNVPNSFVMHALIGLDFISAHSDHKFAEIGPQRHAD